MHMIFFGVLMSVVNFSCLFVSVCLRSCADLCLLLFFFFSSRRRHTRYWRDWSSDVCFFLSSRSRHTRYWRDWISDVCSSDLVDLASDDQGFRRRIVRGQVNDENAWVMGGVAGHAGCFSTAYDVSDFAQCMLRGGSPLVQPQTIEIFTRREDFPLGTSRALGWDTPSQPSQSGKYFSSRSYGHLGYTGTSLWIDPDRQLSVTLLTNRTWPDRGSQSIKQVRPAFHDAIVEAID